MKNIKIAGMLIALTFLIISCSDDSSTNPVTTKNYFPNTTGNYWIFNDFSLDIDNQKEEPDMPSIDSTAITGTEVAFGKTLSKYDIFTLINDIYIKQQEMRLAYDDGSFYMRSNFINTFLKFDDLGVELPFNLPDTLLRIIDTKNANEREVYSKTYTDFGIPDTPFGNLVLNGTMKITSKKALDEVITINGVNVNAVKYTIPISLKGKITASLIYEDEFEYILNYHIWLAENIGIVKTNLESKLLEIPIVNQNFPYYGYVTELVRYNVAK